MIRVLKTNKAGNRILSYTCTDGVKTLDISKDQLVDLINKKQVQNAKVQVYNGTTIVRVKDSTEDINEKAPVYRNPNGSCGTTAVTTDNTIMDYIAKANKSGVETLDLTGIVVDTKTLKIIKTPSVASAGAVENTNDTVESPKILAENLLKTIISNQINSGTYLGMFHNRYGIALGNTGHKIGIYMVDSYSKVCKLVREIDTPYYKVIINSEYFTLVELYRDTCTVEVYSVNMRGTYGIRFKDSLDGFESVRTLISQLNNRFILITGSNLTAILDLDKMILSGPSYRNGMIDIIDISSSKMWNTYSLKVNKIYVSDKDDHTIIRVNTSLRESALGTIDGKYAKGYNTIPMSQTAYIEFKVYWDYRGVKAELYKDTNKLAAYEFEAQGKKFFEEKLARLHIPRKV